MWGGVGRVDFFMFILGNTFGVGRAKAADEIQKVEFLENEDSETCMNRRNSPHSTVPIKSNDKPAVFMEIRFSWCLGRKLASPRALSATFADSCSS